MNCVGAATCRCATSHFSFMILPIATRAEIATHAVPDRHIEVTFNLGVWVGTQRRNKDTMPIERKQRLNEIGFVWHAKSVIAPIRVAFRQRNDVGTRDEGTFAAQWLAYALPCQRFANTLTGICA